MTNETRQNVIDTIIDLAGDEFETPADYIHLSLYRYSNLPFLIRAVAFLIASFMAIYSATLYTFFVMWLMF